MPARAPLVSVIVPAYRAGATLGRAIRSVLDGGLAEESLEILIESDDGGDYAECAGLSPAVRIGVTGAVASGVGPARNRAMARAQGDWLAFLDADDTLAPGHLADLLQAARRTGAAASPMEVIEDGQTILRLWQGSARLSYADLAETGASLRLMLTRDRCPPFVDALAQDILHGVEVMAAQGGSLPLSTIPYRLHLSSHSVTTADDFSARAHRAYLDHIARLESSTLPPDAARAAAEVFRAKIRLNAAYQTEGAGRSYYRFISDRQRALRHSS